MPISFKRAIEETDLMAGRKAGPLTKQQQEFKQATDQAESFTPMGFAGISKEVIARTVLGRLNQVEKIKLLAKAQEAIKRQFNKFKDKIPPEHFLDISNAFGDEYNKINDLRKAISKKLYRTRFQSIQVATPKGIKRLDVSGFGEAKKFAFRKIHSPETSGGASINFELGD